MHKDTVLPLSPQQCTQETTTMEVHSEFFKGHCAYHAWENICAGTFAIQCKTSQIDFYTPPPSTLCDWPARAKQSNWSKRSCLSCLLGSMFFTHMKMHHLLPLLNAT